MTKASGLGPRLCFCSFSRRVHLARNSDYSVDASESRHGRRDEHAQRRWDDAHIQLRGQHQR
ncbi:MAG TPA: hypothetical protein VIM68_07810, partial [Thermoanaerobaculia bacterium]